VESFVAKIQVLPINHGDATATKAAISPTKCSTLGDDHQPIRGLYAQDTTLGPEPYQGPAPPRPRHAAAVVPAPSHRHQAARAA